MIERLAHAVLAGLGEEASAITRELVAGGWDARTILDETLVPAIRRAGDLWESGEFFIPELLHASNAMKQAMAVLSPHLRGGTAQGGASVVIGTIEGDIHDIGKTLVAGMLEAAGYHVIDLGADVPAQRLVDEAVRHGASLICVSALLTTTMLSQRKVVEARDRAGLSGKAFVMVGGAPVTRTWADRIGAEGYAPDAFAAVDEAARLLARAA